MIRKTIVWFEIKLYGLIGKLYGLERNCMVSNHESYGLGRVWGRQVCLYRILVLPTFLWHSGILRWSDCLVSWEWIFLFVINMHWNAFMTSAVWTLCITWAIRKTFKSLTFMIFRSSNRLAVGVLGLTPAMMRITFFCNTTNLLRYTEQAFPHTWLQYIMYFHWRKCIRKHHLRNGGHFVSASMC